MPVAPVNGGGSSGANGSSGGITVSLSRKEQEAANDGTIIWGAHDLAAGRIKDKSMVGKPIGTGEMARRKHQMTKEGHYDKMYVEQ